MQESIPLNSKLVAKFGEINQESVTPISIDLQVSFFEDKIKNKLFNLVEYLELKIQDSPVIFIIDGKENAGGLAKKLNQYLEQNKEEIQLKANILARGSNVYIVIDPRDSENIFQFVKYMTKGVNPEKALNLLQIKIRSTNRLKYIFDKAVEIGFPEAILQSLYINASLDKSVFNKVMNKSFVKNHIIGPNSLLLLDTFEHLNASFQFQGSQFLKNYPKIHDVLKFQRIENKGFFNQFENLLGDKVEFLAKYDDVSLHGVMKSDDIHLLLSLIFE